MTSLPFGWQAAPGVNSEIYSGAWGITFYTGDVWRWKVAEEHVSVGLSQNYWAKALLNSGISNLQ